LRKLIAATTLIAVIGGAARAQENIKIGLIMSLTGNSAGAGQQAKAAIELAAEIVNLAHPEFATLPLASSMGLPNLKGAKLKIITADNQNNPAVGQKQAARLIPEEQVVALQGAYLSSVTTRDRERHDRGRGCRRPAHVGYVAAGIPNPLMFTLLTMAFAMVPLGAWLAFTAAAFMLLFKGGSEWAAAGIIGLGRDRDARR
jgi:Periplasmic binding protein